MSELDIKLYPKTSQDAGGIKFYFDHQDKHYTIRPAWRPILLLEAKFKSLGWKDFAWAYESAQQKQPHAETALLSKAAEHVKDILNTMALVWEMGKSPFVVYIKERNEFKQ